MNISGIIGAVSSCCGGGSKNKVGGSCGLGGLLKKLLQGLTGGCSGGGCGGGGCCGSARPRCGAPAVASVCCARANDLLG